MDYKDKIKEILKDNTIPEQLRKKMEEILLAAEEIEEDKRLKEFLCKTFTKQYLCSDKLGKWHGEPVANILTWLEKQGDKSQGKEALEAVKEEKADDSNKVEPKFHES